MITGVAADDQVGIRADVRHRQEQVPQGSVRRSGGKCPPQNLPVLCLSRAAVPRRPLAQSADQLGRHVAEDEPSHGACPGCIAGSPEAVLERADGRLRRQLDRVVPCP